MFDHLRRLLRTSRGGDPDPVQARRHAAAVLLLEVARADYDHRPAEQDALRQALRQDFGVPDAELDRLLRDAERHADHAVSLHDIVAVLNRTLSGTDKRGLLQWLWNVAHSDGHVDPQEELLLRRLTDLLHLDHADFIAAKLATAPAQGRADTDR